MQKAEALHCLKFQVRKTNVIHKCHH